MARLLSNYISESLINTKSFSPFEYPDFADIRGFPIVKRALEISVAGGHGILFFGPPVFQDFLIFKALDRFHPESKKLILSANACPCGNLGREERVCNCSKYELKSYWKKIKGRNPDSIQMRVPVKLFDSNHATTGKIPESSLRVQVRINSALAMQEERYRNESFCNNGDIPNELTNKFCKVDNEIKELFTESIKKIRLSTIDCLSLLKISRTIADLSASRNIEIDHFLEAVHYRRYGDRDIYWNEI